MISTINRTQVIRITLFILCLILQGNSSAQEYTYLPPGIVPDSLNAPFYHGVASGDPLSDRVVIWTRITPVEEISDTNILVNWQFATDNLFQNIIQTGNSTTDSSLDYTVKVDVSGLSSDTYYHYRFHDLQGNFSAQGRTRTLPVGNVERIQLAVASCANIYYGYFNSYESIALNDDIAAVIHLGDFIYNNNGSNAPNRIPLPEPTKLTNENSAAEWADRHYYYRFDTDLRAMLAAHPIIAIWDNHDIDKHNHEPAMKAWVQWMPVRENPDDFKKLYRQFRFGDLAELIMMEVRVFNETDLLPGGEYHYLGWEQYDWITDILLNTEARWKLIGSQKNFETWNLGWVADLLDLNSPFFTTSNWDGALETRKLMKGFFQDNSIDNIVFLTGDAHMGVLADIDPDPFNDNNDYDSRTGEGSLGVEFLPSGVTGRNLDDRGVPSALSGAVQEISMSINPHQFYLNLAHNGYGILDIRPDSISAYIIFNNIVQDSSPEWTHGPFIVYNKANHWKRTNQSYSVPTFNSLTGLLNVEISEVYPNPASDRVSININLESSADMIIKIIDAEGRNGRGYFKRSTQLPAGEHRLQFDVQELNTGNYIITFLANGKLASKVFTIVR
ncbi:MAG: T9SS type A sorting domain-containing protein [Bacteroidetes bacterium]|nr:T9SS type A sorting domain-containing protein [Bacteroidota bacterium]